jgi:hypothetical protein
VQPSGLSQHPADQLIRELLATGREATTAEIDQIAERLGTAPFDGRVVPVSLRHRGLAYQGRTLGGREATLWLHLTLRVVYDEQWAPGTTVAEYLSALREAIRAPSARLVIYTRRGGRIASILTPNAIPAHRLGAKPETWVCVVYAVDRGTILSGYQASSPRAVSIPGDARWLK